MKETDATVRTAVFPLKFVVYNQSYDPQSTDSPPHSSFILSSAHQMTTDAASTSRKRKNLTPAERAEVVAFLLRVSTELQPPIGVIPASAAKYGCSVDQIARLLRRAVHDIEAGH
ncbi:hypothetical protein PI125_g11629 [Phytophthora idaei]|nr:hypothetical protein PI125_g11629 [Phytophthora idaei]KAG3147003.1 hypothetical protein PI126_g13051 [Phytophthora idaei]